MSCDYSFVIQTTPSDRPPSHWQALPCADPVADGRFCAAHARLPDPDFHGRVIECKDLATVPSEDRAILRRALQDQERRLGKHTIVGPVYDWAMGDFVVTDHNAAQLADIRENGT